MVPDSWKTLGEIEVDSHGLIGCGRRWVTVADSGVVSDLKSTLVAELIIRMSCQPPNFYSFIADGCTYLRLPGSARYLVVLPWSSTLSVE